MADGKGISGIISCWGYGYGVKMLINGRDVGLTGGKSENKRVFSPGHEMYAVAPPAIQEKLFMLKDGANEISVEFKKLSKNDADYLQIALELEGYPAPSFLLHSRSKADGSVKCMTEMHPAAPKDFRPAFITDAGEDQGVLVHADASGCTVSPALNGREGMVLAMRGQSVLDNVIMGKNELAVKYGGTPGGELKLVLVSPEWVKTITRKIADESEKTDTFTFNAEGGATPVASPRVPAGGKPASGTGAAEAPLEMLRSGDALKRFMGIAALREAMERGEDIGFAESALDGALSDKDNEARNAAARLLANFYARGKRWGDIGRLLGHRWRDVRSSALGEMRYHAGEFDIRADLPGMVAALDDNDFEMRKMAALFFEKASAAGIDISFALPGLKRADVYGDERVKEAVSNAMKASEAGKGKKCRDCLDCEAGLGPGDAKKSLEYIALIIKSISCCGGDVTHRVFRCKTCGQHFVSTYFDHSDFDHGQFSIYSISAEQAAAVAAELKKCPNPEFRMCKCEVHMGYLKDEALPVQGMLRHSAGG